MRDILEGPNVTIVKVEDGEHLTLPAPPPDKQHTLLFQADHIHLLFSQGAESPNRAAQPDQLLVIFEQDSMPALMFHRMVQFRSSESLLRLRIGRLTTPIECCELFPSALANRFHKLRVGMTHEVLERRGFTVFVPHEQQRYKWGKQDNAGGKFEGLKRHQFAQPFAKHAIPDLIVVLREDNKFHRWNSSRGVSVPAAQSARVTSRVNEAFGKRLRHVLEITEVYVVSLPLPGEQRVQRVMKVVIPLRIESISAQLTGPDQAGVVQRAFGDDIDAAIEVYASLMNSFRELFQNVHCGVIEDGVDCIQTQRIDVVVLNPLDSVGNKEMPHLVAVRIVEIQGRTPRCLIAVCKVRPKLREVISFRANVVVNHIEHDSETALMAGIHKSLEASRAAVRILNGEGKNAVVSPVPAARELSDRHQLDRRDAGFSDLVEMRNNSVERFLRSESSNVEFVDEVVFDRKPEPVTVFPVEAWIDNF